MWLIYYLYCIFAFNNELFTFVPFMFIVFAFSSHLGSSLNISCNAGLVMLNSLLLLGCIIFDLAIKPELKHYGVEHFLL